MAMTSSFKQQCPSCEAMVPIRDPGLVGKKIDCPKCKYRFVVEEPVPEEPDEEEVPVSKKKNSKSNAVTNKKGNKAGPARRRDEEEPADESESEGKSKGNTKTLYIGIGLGVFALVALIGGGILLFGGSSTPKGSSGGSGMSRPSAVSQAPGGAKTASPSEEKTSPPAAATTTDSTTISDITNLLPNGTEVLINFDIEKLLNSSLKRAMLETPGAFSDAAFQKTFGFPVDNVKRTLTAVINAQSEQHATVFSIMQLVKPFNREFLIKSLQMTPLPSINGFEYFTVNGDVDSLTALLVRSLKPGGEKYAAHFIDNQTIVFADTAPMKKFLEDKRQPQPQTKSAAPAAVPSEPVKPASPPAPGAPPRPGGPPPARPGGPPPAPESSPGTGDVVTSSYLTIDPNLKLVMDRLERDKKPMIFNFAAMLRVSKTLPTDLKGFGGLNGPNIEEFVRSQMKLLEDLRAVAVALNEFNESKTAGVVVLESNTEGTARMVKAFFDNAISATQPPAAAPTQPMPGRPGQPPAANPGNPEPDRDFAAAVSLRNKTVTASASLNLRRTVYDKIMEGLSVGMVQIKGQADLTNNRSRIHELAHALDAYVQEKGAFPYGALRRPPASDRGVDWYPEQRLSWAVSLLPYFGDEFKDLGHDDNVAWYEGDNRATAQVLVPQFLSFGNSKHARVHYPGRPGIFAATHFVGVAGLGLDAAEYVRENEAVAKKLGVFGYNRVCKAADIKDGPEKTIALLQIPADQATPWMAGGGSTVRGVSEGDDALKPFVCTEYKGKKGTFAIMADGKVRFIAESMKPDIFRALCTIAGGEPLGASIDDIAPVVTEEPNTELKTASIPSRTDKQ